MITTNSTYTVAGKALGGYLASASSGGPRPGVLVFHEGGGLSAHTQTRADALAALGYTAFAPDLFGEPFKDRAHGAAFIGALMTGDLRTRVTAAFDHLRAQPSVDGLRIGAIGFCFGGLAALELARAGADMRAVVSFHGGLKSPLGKEAISPACRILVCTGADDPFVGPDIRTAFEAEMRGAAADWQMIVYGGVKHGFTNPDLDPAKYPGCAYDARADKHSWAAMRELFAEVF